MKQLVASVLLIAVLCTAAAPLHDDVLRKFLDEAVDEHADREQLPEQPDRPAETPRMPKHLKKIQTPEQKPQTQDASKPEIQPELTFETPMSALLLKSMDSEPKISLSSAEVRQARDTLRDIDRLSEAVASLRTRLSSLFGKLHQTEKAGDRKSTDLLNYNFIEVTDLSQKKK